MTQPAYWRTVATPWGPMAVNYHDVYVGQSVLTYGEFSPDERRFLCSLVRPGDTVLDAGANIGALTRPLSAAVGATGHVLAVEPQPEVYALLAHNVHTAASWDQRTIGPVTLLNRALGAVAGQLTLPPINHDQDGNFGGVSLTDTGDGQPVEVITVDSLDLTSLRLLKADVEGMELEVVQGAEQTIRRCRPLLYLEADRTDKVPALEAAVQALGYRTYAHRPPLFSRDNHRDVILPLAHLVNVVSINLLGVPSEWDRQEWEGYGQ